MVILSRLDALQAQLAQHGGLLGPHRRPGLRVEVVIAQQVQHAVNGQQLQLGHGRVALGRGLALGLVAGDGDVAQVAGGVAGLRLAGREAEHVGGPVLAPVVPVELAHGVVVAQ